MKACQGSKMWILNPTSKWQSECRFHHVTTRVYQEHFCSPWNLLWGSLYILCDPCQLRTIAHSSLQPQLSHMQEIKGDIRYFIASKPRRVPFKVSRKVPGAFSHIQSDPRGPLPPSVAASSLLLVTTTMPQTGETKWAFPTPLSVTTRKAAAQPMKYTLRRTRGRCDHLICIYCPVWHNVTRVHYKQQRKGFLNGLVKKSPHNSLSAN